MATSSLADWRQGKEDAPLTTRSVTSCREILMSNLQENVSLLQIFDISKNFQVNQKMLPLFKISRAAKFQRGGCEMSSVPNSERSCPYPDIIEVFEVIM